MAKSVKRQRSPARPRSFSLRLRFESVIALGLLLIALWLTVGDAVKTVWLTLRLGHSLSSQGSYRSLLDNDAEALRRRVQKYFLNGKVYIPLEDIIVSAGHRSEQHRINFLMQKACGEAKIYIWIPVQLHFPLIGTRVWEWCWKPAIAAATSKNQ